MKKITIAAILLPVLIFILFKTSAVNIKADSKFWTVQSIDTMKFSRDASRAPLSSDFIDQQMKGISEVGATYVAIDTPYDAEFLPRLKEWVASARKYNLNVWFRGNFSSWEGWFDYPKNLSRNNHLEITRKFILENPDLFREGDIFTPCPECENGGPGDPRFTGDVTGFRQFMIDEYNMTQDTFKAIGKNVITNFDSMNGDVARLVMDKNTTALMGGVVTVDHYVATPEKLASDLNTFAEISGGKVVLGEFGTPIPDINGNLSESGQASWLKNALSALINNPNLIGLNYWVGLGGTTAIWNPNGSPKEAVEVLRAYYKPNVLEGKVTTNIKKPLENVSINYLSRTLVTNNKGEFQIPYIDTLEGITFANSYYTKTATVGALLQKNGNIVFPEESVNTRKIIELSVIATLLFVIFLA